MICKVFSVQQLSLKEVSLVLVEASTLDSLAVGGSGPQVTLFGGILEPYFAHHIVMYYLLKKIEICIRRQNGMTNSYYRNDPKFSDRQVRANSADPDQTAPRGAV